MPFIDVENVFKNTVLMFLLSYVFLLLKKRAMQYKLENTL